MKRVVLIAGLIASLVSVSVAFADSWDDLRAAVYYKQTEKVVALLDSGVSVNLRSAEGWTPLMVAAEQGDVAMVRYLLSRGADASLRNNNGRTAVDVTSSAEIKQLIAPNKPQPPARVAAPAATAAPPAAQPATGNAYCTRLKDEALRLCGTSDSFCRIQALNKQQSCNRTGRWP